MRPDRTSSPNSDASIPAYRRPVSPARRGLIVQRVIVDRWSSAKAAAAFGIERREVEAWVAAFRRCGMASLRQASGGSAANGIAASGSRGSLGVVRRRLAEAGRRIFHQMFSGEMSRLSRPSRAERGPRHRRP